MKIVPYVLALADAARVRARGFPLVEGEMPAEVAKNVLKRNAKRNRLNAGTGHIPWTRPADLGIALRGAEKVLAPEYLRGLLEFVLQESGRIGRVTSCFNASYGFDFPSYRGDNLPWLVYSVWEYGRWTGDRGLLDRGRATLQGLLDSYESELMLDGRVVETMKSDWLESLPRPSSTYNNLCALKMLQLARELGLRTRTDPGAAQTRLREERWRGDRFDEVDAGVLALYLELFDPPLRAAIIRSLDAGSAPPPQPIRVAGRGWLHLGLMGLNGLKRAGLDVAGPKSSLEDLIMRHRNMIEAVDESGTPFRSLLSCSEHGLSMAAGQYLELALD